MLNLISKEVLKILGVKKLLMCECKSEVTCANVCEFHGIKERSERSCYALV